DENQGTVSPTQEVLTIAKGDNDNYLTAGTVVASGSTATADKNYTFKKWTNDFGAAEIKNAKTGEIVIEAAKGGKTYTFTANFASNPTPYNPPVAPKLNKADHYAYVVGYPDGTVQPQGAITRAEVATIFFRLLSDETRDLYWTKDNGYTDVKAGDWFNNAVSTLSNAGIINGYPDGTFRPNAPITRAEMAKVIAMFAELNKDSAGFKDIAGHWAEAYIKLAAGNGWIAGYPDGTFRPDQDITRAETMTMINRVLERVPSEEEHLLSRRVMLTFPDNQPGDWYYIAVQEATNSHTYERYATEKNGDEQWIKLIDNYDWTKLEF
ncbi:MAG: S-layer homology domain-containing protein, partial [Oscillospiraceae bacterium]|nr:S-layer homology domain-containing protein [Oscillospiraceae bacterium]MDY5735625.1 S-layer homology domain-containing protein [Oscillospiraceae bacterium]